MTDSVEEFVREAPGVRSAEIVRTGQYLHVYHGELDEPSGETMTMYTLAPEVTDDAVHDAFERAASQWQNPSTHPNIARVFTRSDRPQPWLAVEKLGGDPLDAAQPELTLAEVRDVITDTAEALRNAALYNTTHLALAPTCVQVIPDADGVGGVVDEWGLERACRVAAGERPVTPFTAPELLNTPDGGTERTDVYGLGAVAYYALTSQPPVAGSGDLETTISAGEITPPSASAESLPTAVDDIVLEALATDPADRPDSAYAFGQTFDRALSPAIEPTPAATSADTGTDSAPDGRARAATGTAGATDEAEAGSDAEGGRLLSRRRALAALGIGAVGLVGAWGVVDSERSTPPTNPETGDDGSGGSTSDSGGSDSDTDGSEGSSDGGTDSGDGASADGGSALSGTLTVGFVAPTSGAFARFGGEIVRGFRLRTDTALDGAVAGADVEYVMKDTELNPETARAVTQELLEEENVDFLIGPVSAASTLAMVPLVVREMNSRGLLWFTMNSYDDFQMSSENCIHNKFRTTRNTWHMGAPIAPFVSENVAENAALVYQDFTAAEQIADFFTERFEEEGGTVVDRFPLDFGTSDFSSTLRQIEDSDAAVTFANMTINAADFVNQYTELGLKGTTPLFCTSDMNSRLIESDNEAAVGVRSHSFYSVESSTDNNQEFVESYASVYEEGRPNPYTCSGYDAAQAMERGLNEVGEMDADAITAALEGAELPSPRGFLQFDADSHDPITDMEVRVVVEEDGEYVNQVVERIDRAESPTWGCDT